MKRALCLLSVLAVAGACAPQETFEGLPPRPAAQAAASVQDVTIAADSEIGATAGGITPVLVTVRNRGEVPIRLAPGQFGLVSQPLGSQIGALPVADRDALPETILAPGEVASGYLYFGDVAEAGTTMDLVAHVEAVDGGVVGTAVLPLLPPGSQMAGLPLP